MHLDAELELKLEDGVAVPTELPVCLQPGRKLPSLRFTHADLLRHGFTEGCPRCFNSHVGDTVLTSNNWESCRGRI